MRNLWPPLGMIEARLLGDKAHDVTIDEFAIGEAVPAEPRPMPPVVSEQVERSVAAQSLKDLPLCPGLVVLLQYDGAQEALAKASHVPVAFCLDRLRLQRRDSQEWAGWLVSPDLDYATDRDVLIEPQDGPSDPLAGMIQAWNPLTAQVPTCPRILAKLSEYRLNIVREVAAEREGSSCSASASPGRVELRSTASGRAVVTGTAVGQADDPRIAYRELYVGLARKIEVGAELVSNRKEQGTAKPGMAGKMIDWLLGHRMHAAGFAVAAVVALLVGRSTLDGQQAPEQNAPQLARNEEPHAAVQAEARPQADQNMAGNQVGESAAPVKPKPDEIGAKEGKLQDGHESKRLSPRPGGERTELAQAGTPKSNGTSGGAEVRESAEVASVFLSPFKNPAMVLAMRSGDDGEKKLFAYRIRLKNATNIDEAVALLNSLGLKVARVDDGNGTIEVIAEKNQVNPQLDRKLQKSGLFLPAKPGFDTTKSGK